MSRKPLIRIVLLVFFCFPLLLAPGFFPYARAGAAQEGGGRDLKPLKVQKEQILKSFREAKKDYLFVSTIAEYEDLQSAKPMKLSPEVRKEIMRVRWMIGKEMMEKARETIRSFQEKHPFLSVGYVLLGDLFKAQKKNDEAQDAYLTAVLCDRRSLEAWDKLLASVGMEKESVKHFRVKRRGWLDRSKKGEEEDEGPVIEGEEELWGDPDEEQPTPLFYNGSNASQEVMVAWLLYIRNRALWIGEGGFQKAFPAEKEYRPSFKEELDCFSVLASMWKLVRAEKTRLRDRDLDALLKLKEKGLLKGYVLFEEYRDPLSKEDGLSLLDLEECKRYFYSFMAKN